MAKKRKGINQEGFNALREFAQEAKRRQVFIKWLMKILERHGFPIDTFRTGASDIETIKAIGELCGISARDMVDDRLTYEEIQAQVEAWAMRWAAEQKINAQYSEEMTYAQLAGKLHITINTLHERIRGGIYDVMPVSRQSCRINMRHYPFSDSL